MKFLSEKDNAAVDVLANVFDDIAQTLRQCVDVEDAADGQAFEDAAVELSMLEMEFEEIKRIAWVLSDAWDKARVASPEEVPA